MDTVTDTSYTPAEERFLAAIDRAADGQPGYPPGAAFIDAERLVELAPMVARYVRDRRPIVLVYPDGDERLIVPTRSRTLVWRDSAVRRLMLKDSVAPVRDWFRMVRRSLR